MNLYVSCGWDKQIHTSATQINLYTSVANTASAFSASSGGGGSGGGFSCGGGSVGAF